MLEEVQFKRPELEDRELIEGYFRRYPSRSCERTFVNVFLWSRFYEVEYALYRGVLLFRSADGENGYAFPAGEDADVREVIEELIADCAARGFPFQMYTVTPENFAKLEEWYPGRFQVEYIRADADYVYDTEKLATLSGKKLHGKRNHINKFKAEHGDAWSYETMGEENLEECFQMALRWRRENGCDDDEEKNAEICVTLNSLRLFRELELTGGLLRVDGQVVAFTLGEEVCPDTFVVHIEKALSEVEGAYTVINQQFVEHEVLGRYPYVNREEDVGLDGLRRAKLSYHPVMMVDKGTVTLREKL